MNLYYQTHSPYARKVLVLIHELGLINETRVTHYETSPTELNAAVFAKNPLGKVPILENGDRTLFDSAIICRCLIEQYNKKQSAVSANTDSYQLEALATGIADAGILSRWEIQRRPEEKRYKPFLDGQLLKLSKAYDYLENHTFNTANNTVDLGDIAIACTLAWVEFVNLPSFKQDRPKLETWYRTFCERPAMRASAYSGTTTDLQAAEKHEINQVAQNKSAYFHPSQLR